MHPLLVLGALFPATALAVVGFFTLFAAERSAGRIRRIGNALGVWLFLLAALTILAGLTAALFGPAQWGGRMGPYHDQMMRTYHPGWAGQTLPVPASAPTTAPAAPQK